VGATLVRRLLDHGVAVRVYDDLSTGDPAHLDDLEVEVVIGDVRDGCLLRAAMSGAGAVVHLAAAGSVTASVDDPMTNFDVNVKGTISLLEAARDAAVRRVVVASTGGALFGRSDPPFDERSTPSPISPYGASKVAAEAYAQAFAGSYGLGTLVLRFANVYGPWSDTKRGAAVEFLRALRDGRPLVVHGDGRASRDFIYVDDVAAAVHAAVDTDLPPGTVLHVATGRETTIRSLADRCRAVAGVPDHPLEHRPARRGEVARTVASPTLALRLLGWRAGVDLDEGLARTWGWLRGRRPTPPGGGLASRPPAPG
jgi:UDP-glucose 4-epimerase